MLENELIVRNREALEEWLRVDNPLPFMQKPYNSTDIQIWFSHRVKQADYNLEHHGWTLPLEEEYRHIYEDVGLEFEKDAVWGENATYTDKKLTQEIMDFVISAGSMTAWGMWRNCTPAESEEWQKITERAREVDFLAEKYKIPSQERKTKNHLAIILWTEALAIRESSPGISNNLIAEALQKFEKIIFLTKAELETLNPESLEYFTMLSFLADIYNNKGEALSTLDNFEEAEISFRQSISTLAKHRRKSDRDLKEREGRTIINLANVQAVKLKQEYRIGNSTFLLAQTVKAIRENLSTSNSIFKTFNLLRTYQAEVSRRTVDFLLTIYEIKSGGEVDENFEAEVNKTLESLGGGEIVPLAKKYLEVARASEEPDDRILFEKTEKRYHELLGV